MPFTFDEEGYPVETPGDDEQQVVEPPADMDEDREERLAAAQAVFAELSPVEERLETAKCYQAILEGSLFSNSDTNPVAAKVEQEFRDFAKDRLEILLGMKQEEKKVAVESPFTEEEIVALKTVAGMAIRRQQAPVAVRPTVAPAPEQNTTVLRRTEAPKPAVTAKPAPKPPTPQAQQPAQEKKQRTCPACKEKGHFLKTCPWVAPDTVINPGEIEGVHYEWRKHPNGDRILKVRKNPAAAGQGGPKPIPMATEAQMEYLAMQQAGIGRGVTSTETDRAGRATTSPAIGAALINLAIQNAQKPGD